ncbi:MAG: LptA/OstA family protein, partial [Acidobacteriota bacterium]
AVLWGRTQKVRYEGGVRAWRGQDVITAAVLEVFRRERRVEAEGKVSTSYVQRVSGTGSAGRPLPVTISSDSLKYRGEEGQATYLGNVALRTAQTSIQAARMDVLFSRKGEGEVAQVEQATGEGQVVMIQPGRRAEGERMTYLPETGEIILEGGPPVAYDQQRGSTTGQRLTFSLTDDSIGVHGGENSPTITRHRRVQ